MAEPGAAVLRSGFAPPAPGELRAPNPAGTMTRKRDSSEVEELRVVRPGVAPWGSWRPEPRANAAVGAPGGARPMSLGARRLVRCLLRAAFGTLRCGVPHQRLPAHHPLVREGTKRKRHPVRF